MRYVTYQLYEAAAPRDPVFDGGYYVTDGVYFGYLTDSTKDVDAFISRCADNYQMTELTAQEAEDFKWVANGSPPKFILQPEQQLIIANGLHVAKIVASALYVAPYPATDILIVSGEEQQIELTNGTATIEITSTTPGTVFALEYHGLYAVVEAK